MPCYQSRGMSESLEAVFVGLHALGPVIFFSCFLYLKMTLNSSCLIFLLHFHGHWDLQV